VLFVWPFIADTAQTLAWRACKRERIFDAHRSHIYQRLAATFPSREQGHWVVGLLYGGLALMGMGLHFRDGPFWGKLGVLGGVWVAVVAWTVLREGELRDRERKAKDAEAALDAEPTNSGNGPSPMNPSSVGPFEIPLCPPSAPETLDLLPEVLKAGNIGPYGPQLDAFKHELSRYHEGAEVILTTSGTAALHLALVAQELAPGDRILCPTFTFVATLNAVCFCGAVPVLADCRHLDWGIDTGQLAKALAAERAAGHRVRGVMVVHAYGIPMDVEPVAAFCREHGLFLIEDTAGALGSKASDGRAVGLSGLASAGSFNANKLLTTGMGGMLVTSDAALAARARLYANQGKTEAIHYEHEVVGMNYRMSNYNAALGLAQWPLLAERLASKARQFQTYKAALEPLGFSMMPQPQGTVHNHWMHAALVPNGREADPVIRELRAQGIEAAPLWKPMHQQPVYKDCAAYLNGTSDELFARGLCLPSGSGMTEAQQERVIAAVRGALG
jgi:dTDP-4-amino-4,6-dideoxygalactose transaminase